MGTVGSLLHMDVHPPISQGDRIPHTVPIDSFREGAIQFAYYQEKPIQNCSVEE